MKRIFHVADTHIGYSAYRKIDEATGLNQREVDTYDAFTHVVECALEDRPDVIVHAGDLFDSVRPTNRAISFALEQLLRLSEARIPFVVISGNHETPRLKETGSVFSLFEHIPHIYPVYGDTYEVVELGDLTIHAIPHCADIEAEKKRMVIEHTDHSGFHVALLHAIVLGSGLPTFMMGEFNEQTVGIDDLTGFDYLALGHYHTCTRVRADAYYAGSTERFSFNEVRDEKGFLDVTLTESSDPEVRFRPLQIRPMADLEPVVCTGLDAHAIEEAITGRIKESQPDNKVVRLKVLDIPMHVYHSLDFDELKRLTRSAIHFELKYEFRKDNELFAAGHPTFHSLHTEFEYFMSRYSVDPQLDKARLKELGLKYMQAGEEEEEGEELHY